MSLSNNLFLALTGSVLFHATIFMGVNNTWTAEYEYIVSPASLEISLIDSKMLKQKKISAQKEKIEKRELQKQASLSDIPSHIDNNKKANQIIREKNLSQGALSPAKPLAHLNRPPSYPHRARMRGYEGEVVLKVVVTTQGDVKDLLLLQSSGHALLDNAAKKAIEKWRFEPAHILGIKKSSSIEIPIIFKLQA